MPKNTSQFAQLILFYSQMDVFWKSPHWEKTDPHLTRLKEMPFQRDFPVIDFKASVFVIRGPRQIGKTSLLKTLLSKALTLGKTCFYQSCEPIQDFQELIDFIDLITNSSFCFNR